MKVEQIYTGCLAQGAYYIESDGEAAIIDPLREIQPYLEKLKNDQAKLRYIFETHFHADFVSGHLDLSRTTGAPIVYGEGANPDFPIVIAGDEKVFELGKVKIKALHTPGHTLESTCYLLFDENGKETALFSGDTLFLGDVGRPDLAQKGADLTKEDLAGMLYDSLTKKIISLPDALTIYPGHGAGSACGKNMQKETVDTLGNQKKTNYALRQPDKESFVKAVTDGLAEPQAYFKYMVQMNKGGYESFDKVLKRELKPLSANAFEQMAEESGALVLDTRNAGDFCKGFVPKSVNIGLKGSFAPWVGAMLGDVQQLLLLVTDEGKEEETMTRLSRVGFDNVLGFLQGGINTWKKSGKEVDTVDRISADRFAAEFENGSQVIDVRKQGEWEAGHIENALHQPVDEINRWIKNIDPEKHYFIHCAGGYRSMIAASILEARGYRNFSEIDGGYNAIKKTEIPQTV